jgi:AmmeMemoRadiSam system protein B
MAGPLRVRPPAVAGTFYPADPDVLAATVDRLLGEAAPPAPDEPPPAALLAPHAGYRYSGAVAATAFRRAALRPGVRRVVVAGPAHFVPLRGVAVPGVDAFATPLGPCRIDAAAREAALACPGVTVDDAAHAPEHALEVELPFVLRALGEVPVLPLAVGLAGPEEVAGVLDAVWDPETLLVVSSDLSHYLPEAAALRRDAATLERVLALDEAGIGPDDACGVFALRGLCAAARGRGLRPRLLDRRTSADAGGDRRRVVGYAAVAFDSI